MGRALNQEVFAQRGLAPLGNSVSGLYNQHLEPLLHGGSGCGGVDADGNAAMRTCVASGQQCEWYLGNKQRRKNARGKRQSPMYRVVRRSMSCCSSVVVRACVYVRKCGYVQSRESTAVSTNTVCFASGWRG